MLTFALKVNNYIFYFKMENEELQKKGAPFEVQKIDHSEEVTNRSRQAGIMDAIRRLKVGERVLFPIEFLDTVRVTTSKCNLLYQGKRISRTLPDEGKIAVSRLY